MRRGAAGFKPGRPWIPVLRTASGFGYFASFYWALHGIPVADALVLESTNPLAYTLANRLIPSYLVGALFYILVGAVADHFLFRTELGGRGLVGMALTVAAGFGLARIRSREGE